MTPRRRIFSIGRWIVKSGKEQVFLEKWKAFAAWTFENFPGAEWVYMVQDVTQNNQYISFGAWESLVAIDEWRKSPRFRTSFMEFKELCEEIVPETMMEVFNLRRG